MTRTKTLSLRRSVVPLRVGLDVLAIVSGLGLAVLFRFGFGWFEVRETAPTTVRAHMVAALLWVGVVLAAMALNRLYDEDTLFPGGGEGSRIVRSIVEAGGTLSVFVFLTQSFYVSRSWFALTVVFSMAFVASERIALRRFLEVQRLSGKKRRPAILVSRSEQWADWPFEEQHEFNVVARLAPDEFEGFLEGVDDEGPGEAMARAAVVLRARDFSHDEFWRILLFAGGLGWSVFVHSPVRSVGRDRLTVRELAGQTIVKVAPPVLMGARAAQKRIFDVALSGLLLILTSPLLVVIALIVLISSGRPALFAQERVGRDGRPFKILKFRTMSIDAEDVTGPIWASGKDPRTTRIGRILRRTSLDELPQLWNVLKGDMSLVGPRPERPTFVEGFEQEVTWYRFRHRMRPGITGWAQTHGLRGNTSIDTRVQFDNWYIENWSVWLDLKIMLLTIREVISGKNAY